MVDEALMQLPSGTPIHLLILRNGKEVNMPVSFVQVA